MPTTGCGQGYLNFAPVDLTNRETENSTRNNYTQECKVPLL
jgi:hypothetical protein